MIGTRAVIKAEKKRQVTAGIGANTAATRMEDASDQSILSGRMGRAASLNEFMSGE
tara:strand:+ start:345 stop:512 length:168 start_codon:yes stop_codon:yes gene_type:complete